MFHHTLGIWLSARVLLQKKTIILHPVLFELFIPRHFQRSDWLRAYRCLLRLPITPDRKSQSQIWHDLQFMSHDVEVVFAGKYQNYIISYRVIKSAQGILERYTWSSLSWHSWVLWLLLLFGRKLATKSVCIFIECVFLVVFSQFQNLTSKRLTDNSFVIFQFLNDNLNHKVVSHKSV